VDPPFDSEDALMAEVYLNARKAAEYVGYDVGPGPSRTDRGMRAFYELVRRHRVAKHRIGRRLMFKQTDLDAAAAAASEPAAVDPFARMEALARAHARGTAGAH
jgi:hypothetical protein